MRLLPTLLTRSELGAVDAGPAPARRPREQLREGAWWAGPPALVVVDDHDLVAAASGDQLSALLDLLPVARDVGLHVVVARPAGGVVSAPSPPVQLPPADQCGLQHPRH